MEAALMDEAESQTVEKVGPAVAPLIENISSLVENISS